MHIPPRPIDLHHLLALHQLKSENKILQTITGRLDCRCLLAATTGILLAPDN